jgi:hypothetical protein
MSALLIYWKDKTMITLIEILDPAPDAMVRMFTCNLCDKRHLQFGKIARIWVDAAGGYASNAAYECWIDNAPRATPADIARMWKRLWGEITEPVIPSDWLYWADDELLDLTQLGASDLSARKN